jgi:hypothetical protein
MALKRFCKRNHDTLVVGRDQNDSCIECKKIISKDYHVRHRDEELRKSAEWRKLNSDKLIEYNQNYYKENKEKEIARALKWTKENPESVRISRLKATTNRNLRIVGWTDFDNIKEFYQNMPEGMTEDHIIPLQGKKVSGLHVSWNLQYLTHKQNSEKHNNCTPEEATKFYEKILVEAGLK